MVLEILCSNFFIGYFKNKSVRSSEVSYAVILCFIQHHWDLNKKLAPKPFLPLDLVFYAFFCILKRNMYDANYICEWRQEMWQKSSSFLLEKNPRKKVYFMKSSMHSIAQKVVSELCTYRQLCKVLKSRVYFYFTFLNKDFLCSAISELKSEIILRIFLLAKLQWKSEQ